MTDIDDRARQAARRLRDDVVETIDLDLAADRARAPRRRNTVALAVGALAVVALVAAAALLSPGDGDVEVAIDEEETTTTSTTVPVPDPATPAPIRLGAPDDGKDSVGLPVSADPSTGLVDGQTVAVTGSGFPPGESIGVVMCTREAGAEHGGRGVDACNIGHFAQGTSDQQGNVTIDFAVRRLAMLDGQEVDCASEPGRCIIGMGMINDYDQSGGVAIDFDPSAPLPDPPVVTLGQTEGIADGQVVAARVTGLRPGTSASVELCAEDGPRCTWITEIPADDEGTFDGGLRLWRNFGSYPQPGSQRSVNVDCAMEACILQVYGDTAGGRAVPPVPVMFDPARGARVAPTMQLADPGPYASGDTVELLVDGLAAENYIDTQVCSTSGPATGACIAYAGGQYDGSGQFSTQLYIEAQGIADPCQQGCVLIASVYPETNGGPAQGPPPLFPEPVPILITT